MVNLITPKVKKEIIKTTTYLSNAHYLNNCTNLAAICEEEGLFLYEDDYGDYFDGMLVWEKPNFHIHLNIVKGNRQKSKRGRFTCSHELGHYFLDAHREGIRKGLIPAHLSNQTLIQSNKMEAEADYFASCLLMPEERLKRLTGRRKFSLEIIQEISDTFDVSLTSAALRFAEVGTHEVMVVFSEMNQVKWYLRSYDFPSLANRFKVGGVLPPTTVAGESFLRRNAKFTGVESVDLEDWFYYRSGAPDRNLFEQCFYSDIYGYVISLIWFE